MRDQAAELGHHSSKEGEVGAPSDVCCICDQYITLEGRTVLEIGLRLFQGATPSGSAIENFPVVLSHLSDLVRVFETRHDSGCGDDPSFGNRSAFHRSCAAWGNDQSLRSVVLEENRKPRRIKHPHWNPPTVGFTAVPHRSISILMVNSEPVAIAATEMSQY